MGWVRQLVVAHKLKAFFYLCHTTKTKKDKENITAFRGTGAMVEQADAAFLLVPGTSDTAGYLRRVKSRAMDETVEHVPFHYDVASGTFLDVEEHKLVQPILELLAAHLEGLTTREIRESVKGQREKIITTLKLLLQQKRIASNGLGGTAHRYLLKPGAPEGKEGPNGR